MSCPCSRPFVHWIPCLLPTQPGSHSCHFPVPSSSFSLSTGSFPGAHTHATFLPLGNTSLDPTSPTSYSLISLPCAPPLPAPTTSPSSTWQATIISCLDNCNSLLIDLPSTLAPLLSDLHTAAKRIFLNVNLVWDKTLFYAANKYLHNLCSLPRALATWPFCSSRKQPSHTASMGAIALFAPSA